MQNPPPGKQAYGSRTGSPATGSGLDPKVAAALSYIWIVGLIFFFIEKENKYVRFHALQSILFGIANMIIMVLLVIVGMILSFIGIAASAASDVLGTVLGLVVGLVWLLFALVGLGLFLGLIFAAIKAYQGEMFKLPFIGNMAEKIVNKPAA